MIVRVGLPAFVCAAVVFSLHSPASADPAAEAYLTAWVQSIDALPNFRATSGAVTSDTTAGTTTLSGLSVTSEPAGFTATVDAIVVTAFAPTTDGSFAAGALKIEGAKFGGGDFVEAQIANADFRDFKLPPNSGFAWDDGKPFISLIKALSPLAKVEMSSGRLSSIMLVQTHEGIESRITYEQVNIDGWADGKIAAIGAGPIRSQSPDVDQLTAMTIASAQTRDLNLNAIFEVYDPDSYPNGRGDMVWRPVLGKTTYRDMIAAIPGVTFTLKEATLEGVKLRQPKNGIGILAAIGTPEAEAMADDPIQAMKLLELFTSYGFDAFTMSEIEVKAPGIRDTRLAGFSMRDISSDKLGEIAFDRLNVVVDEQGSVAVRRFAFGDLVPPTLEAFIAAVAAEQSGGSVDVPSVIPTLGFLEASGVDVNIVDNPRTTLEHFRVDLRDYVGPIPTTVAMDLVDADVDASLIDDEDVRQMLAALGYDRVVLDASARGRWTAEGDINFESFSFGMKDVGTISGDASFTGIKPTEYAQLSEEAALEKLSFVRGSVTAKDDSIVGRGLAMQAQELGVEPEAFRQQFAMGLPFMLMFLGDPQLQGELAPVLQQFISTAGGSITVFANPVSPQPVMALAAMAEAGPDAALQLVKLLRVTFSGIPGVGPEPAAAPEATTEPASPPADAPAAEEVAPQEPAAEPPVEEPAPEPEAEPAPPSKNNDAG